MRGLGERILRRRCLSRGRNEKTRTLDKQKGEKVQQYASAAGDAKKTLKKFEKSIDTRLQSVYTNEAVAEKHSGTLKTS